MGGAGEVVGRCPHRHGVAARGYDPSAVLEIAEGTAVEAETNRGALTGLQGDPPERLQLLRWFTGPDRVTDVGLYHLGAGGPVLVSLALTLTVSDPTRLKPTFVIANLVYDSPKPNGNNGCWSCSW